MNKKEKKRKRKKEYTLNGQVLVYDSEVEDLLIKLLL